MDFSLKEAIAYSQEGKINEWFDVFLREKGGNIKLANIMKDGGYLDSLVIADFAQIKRGMGPIKEQLKFQEDEEKWETRVKSLEESIQLGWECPPFVVWYIDNEFVLADGNHRFEALKRLGVKKYWVSVWYKDEKDFFEKSIRLSTVV